jgi:hypothetical protein
MSAAHSRHPSTNELAAFADGKLVDAITVEAHIDTCAACAALVVVARQTAHMASEGLIPALSASERLDARERLRKILNGVNVSDTAADHPAVPKEPKPAAGLGLGLWGALGALGGALGASEFFGGPAPALAGSDAPLPSDVTHVPEHGEHPDTDGHHSEPEAPATDFHHSDVSSNDDTASDKATGPSSGAADVTEFLARAQALLDAADASSHDHTHASEETVSDAEVSSGSSADHTSSDALLLDEVVHEGGHLDADAAIDGTEHASSDDHSTDDHHGDDHHSDDHHSDDHHLHG